MPRVAEARDAAEPSSAEQRARFARMLDAAAQLGAEKDLERVQMHEVAKLARRRDRNPLPLLSVEDASVRRGDGSTRSTR